MRLFASTLLLCMLIGAVACGGGSSSTQTNSSVTGNWQMQLTPPNSTEAWQLSGFLQQSGNSVTGSFLSVPDPSGFGCNGVGSVNGTLNDQKLKLDVSESSQDVSLSANLSSGPPSSSTPLIGQFSTLAAGCTSSSATGTWSAVLVKSVSGSFHGTFTPPAVSGEAPISVSGTLSQGPNAGASNASLTGTINASGPPRFCSYLNSATITGLISGTQVTLDIFGSDGTQIGKVGPPAATLKPDGTKLSCEAPCNYSFSQISKSCTGDFGTVELTFP